MLLVKTVTIWLFFKMVKNCTCLRCNYYV